MVEERQREEGLGLGFECGREMRGRRAPWGASFIKQQAQQGLVAHMAMAAASYSYRKKNDKSAKKT
jgi:hypothetical protein